MTCHDKICTCCDGLFKGNKFHTSQSVHIMFHIGFTQMAVHGSIPMSREMFCTGTDACFLNGSNKFCYFTCRCLRVRRKGSCTNNRIIRICIHIRYRGKVYVDAQFCQFHANGFTCIRSIFHFCCIRKCFMRNIALFQTGNQTAFFIDTNEQW